MRILDLSLFANIYIIFFWLCYSILLNKSKFFGWNRMYILSAFSLAVILPCLHNTLGSVLGSSKALGTTLKSLSINYINGGYSVINHGEESQAASLDWNQAISLVIICGFLVTTLYFIISHIRIKTLIKNSILITKNQNKVYLCKEEIVPFIYKNHIVIPFSTPYSDRDMIIRHESRHYHLGHHYDNYMIQLFQILFWMNPFFYLLKKQLKQVHEYQVDNDIISSGIDAVQYKLALVKFRAGYQKYAIANGLNTNLKNRLKMMNSNQNPKGKWKILLSVPVLSFLFLVFSFSCINPDLKAPKTGFTSFVQETDSVEIKLITLPDGIKIEEPREAIIVLINKVSHVAIEGKFAPEGKRVDMIIREYEKLREERFFNQLSPVVKIITQKDQNTSEEDYKALLDEISTALFTLHEKYSKNRYNRSFNQLTEEEKSKILEFIPPVIYYAPPKHIKPPPKK